jgi:hypothetical protein
MFLRAKKEKSYNVFTREIFSYLLPLCVRKNQTKIMKPHHKFLNINSMRIKIIVKKQFNKVNNNKSKVV